MTGTQHSTRVVRLCRMHCRRVNYKAEVQINRAVTITCWQMTLYYERNRLMNISSESEKQNKKTLSEDLLGGRCKAAALKDFRKNYEHTLFNRRLHSLQCLLLLRNTAQVLRGTLVYLSSKTISGAISNKLMLPCPALCHHSELCSVSTRVTLDLFPYTALRHTREPSVHSPTSNSTHH